MSGPVVVPLDGSPFGESALPLAQAIAERSKSELRLIQVHETIYTSYVDGGPIVDEEMDRAFRDNEAAYMEEMEQRMAAQTSVPVSAKLLDGAVTGSIARYAENAQAAYIVLTSHGRGGIARAWLGSVADSLLRHSDIPLVMLRPAHDTDASSEQLPTRDTLRHVLIALDGSQQSEQVLALALRLGALFHADYTLLQVVDTPTPYSRPSLRPTDRSQRAEPRRDAIVREYLERVQATLSAEGFRVKTSVVTAEQPATAILRQAQERGCDVIALATHGRGGVARLLLGSVADKVLRGAEDQVLLVLPAQHDHSPRTIATAEG